MSGWKRVLRRICLAVCAMVLATCALQSLPATFQGSRLPDCARGPFFSGDSYPLHARANDFLCDLGLRSQYSFEGLTALIRETIVPESLDFVDTIDDSPIDSP